MLDDKIVALIKKDIYIIPSENQFKKIASLMKEGVDFSEGFKYAIISGKEQYIDFFLSKKININYDNGAYLANAILSENIPLVAKLIGRGALLNGEVEGFKRPLSFAISIKNLNMIDVLLNKGAKLSPNDLLQCGDVSLFKFLEGKAGKLIDKKDSLYAKYSVIQNSLEKTKYLIENGYSFEEDSFEEAVNNNNTSIMKTLIENNVGIGNAGIIKLNLAQNFMIIKLLLDQDKIDQEKCLCFAIISNNKPIVKYLLEDKKTPFDKKNTLMDVLDNGDLKAYLEDFFKKNDKKNTNLAPLLNKLNQKNNKKVVL